MFIGVTIRQNTGVDMFTCGKARTKLAELMKMGHGADVVGTNFAQPQEFSYLFMVPVGRVAGFLKEFDDGSVCDAINEWYDRMKMTGIEGVVVPPYYYPLLRRAIRWCFCGYHAAENRLLERQGFLFMTATLIRTFEAMALFDDKRLVERMVKVKVGSVVYILCISLSSSVSGRLVSRRYLNGCAMQHMTRTMRAQHR